MAHGSVSQIHGDDVEHHRRQLESNPLINDISLPMSDVEQPRFNPASGFDDYVSFNNSHPWSYVGEDNSLSPYTGATISTAAHHASALTLSAGLGDGRYSRRDPDLSGAEFDPERPVSDVIAGADAGHSLFDLDGSKSRDTVRAAFDPLIVDSTSELDRVLRLGYVQPIPRDGSPHPSSASSTSDSDSGAPSRSKLSEALNSVGFSPKRLREDPAHILQPQLPGLHDEATPRPCHTRKKIFPQYGPQPALKSHPPTPSTAVSKFTQAARGLAREIQAEALHNHHQQSASKSRDSFDEPDGNQQAQHQPNVVLPDVTGLTSAVESPIKGDPRKFDYSRHDRPRGDEARILASLTVVQSKLQNMETQNGISRRRIRELEMELEACKEDVKRERTRLLEEEHVSASRQPNTNADKAIACQTKGKGKTIDRDVQADLRQRYREVVEEKKALEALVTTLRAHLKRLTSELSSHRELLTELKTLRESDASRLKSKEVEVERLRREVERLAGEVQVLKAVVEEGLRERGSAKEATGTEDIGGDGHDKRSWSQMPHPESEKTKAKEHLGNERALRSQFDGPSCREMLEDHDATRNSVAGPSNRKSTKPASVHFAPSIEPQQICAELREPKSFPSTSPSPGSPAVAPQPPSQPPSTAVSRPIDASREKSPSVIAAGVKTTATPFPRIRGEHLERLFLSAPDHDFRTCSLCSRKIHGGTGRSHVPEVAPSWLSLRNARANKRREPLVEEQTHEDEGFVEGYDSESRPRHAPEIKGKQKDSCETNDGGITHPRHPIYAQSDNRPPQSILVKVLRELEDDFTHYKAIYVELADQYKVMDAVSNVPKRNILARHLKEVVEVLEQKGNQIASLYDLLTFKDKPINMASIPHQNPDM